MKRFIITKFHHAFFALDPKGRRKEIKNRYFAGFIIPLKGRICFTSGGVSVCADSEHPVFLPGGLTYVNKCLNDAASFVFNFDTLDAYNEILPLAPVSHRFAKETYAFIKSLNPSFENSMQILERLYALAYRLMSFEQDKSASDSLIDQALDYIARSYPNPGITVSDIADHCFISEIYLRKLFTTKLNTTPFKKLTEVRMKTARLLLLEKRAVKEIALAVGYSDVYQFSRAYSRYYGIPPTKTEISR